jgi:hypothetical protein
MWQTGTALNNSSTGSSTGQCTKKKHANIPWSCINTACDGFSAAGVASSLRSAPECDALGYELRIEDAVALADWKSSRPAGSGSAEATGAMDERPHAAGSKSSIPGSTVASGGAMLFCMYVCVYVCMYVCGIILYCTRHDPSIGCPVQWRRQMALCFSVYVYVCGIVFIALDRCHGNF